MGFEDSADDITMVIQGGAMRSIYCAGAARAVLEKLELKRSPSIFAASAGCVTGLGLYVSQGSDVAFRDYCGRLLKLISGDRFVNKRRIRRVVDVEFLVDSMFESAELRGKWAAGRAPAFEVALTDAEGVPSYVDVAALSSLSDVRAALVATMAIPLFYPIRSQVNGQPYWDGGISDPLPLIRALQSQSSSLLICISNVPPGRIGRPASGKERAMLKVLGHSIPDGVVAQMVAHNALGATTERIMRDASFGGRAITSIFPSNVELLGGRLDTAPEHLSRLEALGHEDGAVAMKDVPVPG